MRRPEPHWTGSAGRSFAPAACWRALALLAAIALPIACHGQSTAAPPQVDATIAPAADAAAVDVAVADAALTDGTLIDAPAAFGACPPASADPARWFSDQLDEGRLQTLLKEMAGVNPVTVAGNTYSLTDRYLATSKAHYRAYWIQYFKSLGLSAVETSFPTSAVGEQLGHNVEAVLTGDSPDSVVFIVHYDSIGAPGHETENPGVDDDMSGMAIMLETARLLTSPCIKRQYTVRFVAADLEERGRLEGARVYAKAIAAASQAGGWKLISGMDFEQSGWNCASDVVCTAAQAGKMFEFMTCSVDKRFDFKALGDSFAQTVTTYSPLQTVPKCIGPDSDVFALWEIGVPAVVFGEYRGFDNPHFDQSGGDVYATIDPAYHGKIARAAAAFSAKLAGAALR